MKDHGWGVAGNKVKNKQNLTNLPAAKKHLMEEFH
jgi:hypothetical protein